MSLEFNEALMTLVKRQEIYMFPVDTDVFQIFSGDFFTYPELPVMPGLVEYVDPKKTYWMPICLSTDKSIHDKQWTTPHNTDYRGEKMHLRMVYPDGHTEDING